jgi:alpha-beta hydrolase superfamily lysophospholipase
MGQPDEHTFTDRYGVEVSYRYWPSTLHRGTVVIAHGASEHGGRYGRFAEALNRGGYDAVAPDHRGHGATGASTGVGRTGPGGGAALVDDLGAIIAIARERVAGAPVVLFGHSMGSMITQAYAAGGAEGLAGYILSGPLGAVEGGAEMAAGMREAAGSGLAEEPLDLLGAYNEPFEPARTPFDWLSRDEAEVDAYLADPRCGSGNPLTYGFVADLLELAVPAVEPAAISRIPAIPVLIVAGEQDPAGGMGANVRVLEERLRSAGLAVTSHYYPGARHELLNETIRDEVTADIVAWLDEAVTS